MFGLLLFWSVASFSQLDFCSGIFGQIRTNLQNYLTEPDRAEMLESFSDTLGLKYEVTLDKYTRIVIETGDFRYYLTLTKVELKDAQAKQ